MARDISHEANEPEPWFEPWYLYSLYSYTRPALGQPVDIKLLLYQNPDQVLIYFNQNQKSRTKSHISEINMVDFFKEYIDEDYGEF